MDPDSDSDQDHPRHEPEFVIHAADGDRPRPLGLLPPPHHHVQHLPQPQPWPQLDADHQARQDRLSWFAIQAGFCVAILAFACMAIYFAKHLPETETAFSVAALFSGLIIVCALMWLLLSYFGIDLG